MKLETEGGGIIMGRWLSSSPTDMIERRSTEQQICLIAEGEGEGTSAAIILRNIWTEDAAGSVS